MLSRVLSEPEYTCLVFIGFLVLFNTLYDHVSWDHNKPTSWHGLDKISEQPAKHSFEPCAVIEVSTQVQGCKRLTAAPKRTPNVYHI